MGRSSRNSVSLPNRKTVRRTSLQFLLLFSMLGWTAACNMPALPDGETLPPDLTQVYETVLARLTQAPPTEPLLAITPSPTNNVLPTGLPTGLPNGTPNGTPSPSPTLASNPTNPSLTPAASTPIQPTLVACDAAGAGTPIDVTIPDDTHMEPGQSFTKIWRLQNVGTCTWTSNYRVIFFSGERLGAPENMALNQEVSPGQSVDIAIDMLAPPQAGTFQGNWKLRNPNGVAFGIGPSASAPFWVRIVVVAPTPTASGTPTISVTPSPTLTTTQPAVSATPGTPTPSPTVTQVTPVSMVLTIRPGDVLDLDSGELNSNTGADLLYASNPDGLHRLVPQTDALLGVFGEQRPTPVQCASAELTEDPLIALNFIQRYLCYRTEMGEYGWAYIEELNPDTYIAQLEFLTWITP